MTERHAEPGADVGSFLPRPGEPVGAYAERLRALHRDLTLVLEAVERGLAASSRPEDEPAAEWDPGSGLPRPRSRRFQRREPGEARLEQPVEEPPRRQEVADVRPGRVEPAPGEHDVGPLLAPVPVRASGARVVVMPSGTGALSRREDERAGDRPDPLATEPVERTIPAPTLPPAAPDEQRPAETPAWPPPAPAARSTQLPPVTLALAAAGWLTAIALILAIALGL